MNIFAKSMRLDYRGQACWRIAAIVSQVALLCAVIGCGVDELESRIRRSPESITITSADKGFPVDLVLLLDQSGSMNGVAGSPATDPNQLRVNASRYFIKNVSLRSKTRMGIVSFGTGSEVEAPLTDIADEKDRKKLSAAVRARNMGFTNFMAALDDAVGLFEGQGTFEKGIKPVIVIFTDGSPADKRRLEPAVYFKEIAAKVTSRLEPEQCDIYVIGIDDTGKNWSLSRPEWEKIVGKGHVFSIAGMEQLRQRFNEIVQRVWGIPLTTPDIVTAEGLEFEAPPYLDSIEFHIFPQDPELELEVTRPDGSAVNPAKDEDAKIERFKSYDKYDILTVAEPEVGKWSYRILQGRGRVEVFRNPIPVRVTLLEPEPEQPLGRGFTVRVRLDRRDGGPVKELSEYPLRLVARFSKPGEESPKDFLLSRVDEKVFMSSERLDADKVGKWEAEVLVKGGHEYSFSQSAIFEVVATPYIEVEEPTKPVPLGDGIPVKVSVKLGGEPLDVSQWFFDPAMNLVIAQVKNLPGGDSAAVFLNHSDDMPPGKYEGYVPANLESEGSIVLALRLKGVGRDSGKIVTDFVSHPLNVAMTPWQRLQAGAFNVGIAVLLIALAMPSLFVLWYATLPVIRQPGAGINIEGPGGLLLYESLEGRRLLRINTRILLQEQYAPPEGMQTDEPDKSLSALPKHIWVRGARRGKDAEDMVDEYDVAILTWRGIIPSRTILESGESSELTRDGSVYIKYV